MSEPITIFVVPYSLGGFVARTSYLDLHSQRARKTAKKAFRDAIEISNLILKSSPTQEVKIDYSLSGLTLDTNKLSKLGINSRS